jgi:AcrR family transcriptional regulator
MSKASAHDAAAHALRTGRARQKQRTHRLLLDAARTLIAAGSRPTVSDVADAAEVSRRTAYRYFPTQRKLMADAALDGLRPVMEAAIAATPPDSAADSLELRVDALVSQMQKLTIENESLLRTMIHETVLQQPFTEGSRGGRRIEWIELAIKPMRAQLGSAAYARLVSALALCSGIEALLVLRDIRGLSAQQAIHLSRWMARALVRQSLTENNGRKRKPRA